MKNRNGWMLAVLMLCSSTLNAQSWVDLMLNDTVNFYTVQDAFNTYWAGKPIEKGKGYKQYKRWEWFTEQRVYPSGVRYDHSRVLKEFQAYQASHPALRSTNGNWSSMGPNTVPGSGGGAGRINCIRFDPSNINIVYAGAPAGGLWKSTDAGASWNLLNTDYLQSLGVYDVAIDPTDSDIIYIATGDVDGGDTYSVGVLKSTDGGLTWNSTGLSFETINGRQISRLIIDPTDHNKLYAAGNGGFYRSTDGGINWTNTLIGNFRDMELKPGSSNVIYVCGTVFKYSTDGGTTWNNTIATLTLMNRMTMAVTPANSSYVYLLSSNSGDNGFQSLLRSTDSGASFTTMSDRTTDPNILGWSSTGSDEGGQGWYDLALAVSPTNADLLFTGGVNIWKSTNGGASFSISAHWTGAGAADYVHADIHDLQFATGSGTIVYAGCDGGVFKTTNTGSDWFDFSDDLEIGQMYRLGVSQTDADRVITGWQDNGTNLVDGGSWDQVLGGDGMECIISHSSASTMYGSLYYGEIHKSTSGGSFWTEIVSSSGTGVDSQGPWITPYVMWAGNASYLYVAKSQVYKSTNAGTSFTQVGTIPGGGSFNALAVAPSNSNYIYAARGNTVYVTTTGSTWTTGTGIPSGTVTSIAISNTDPNKAWITMSGFDAGEKVFETTNAGSTWTNISGSLPNIPANTVIMQNSTADALYVGMDIGVYYKDDSMTDWILFNQGLPNTIISELEIQYSTSKLRAATYGRGLWESDLFTLPTSPPVAAFNANATTTCVGIPVQFTDVSTNIPTSWSWDFGTSATPSTSTEQDPVVVFTTPGTYNVTLSATNGFGTGTTTITSMITVMPEITNNIIGDDQLYCSSTIGDTLTGTVPTGGFSSFSYNWIRSYVSSSTSFINLTTATNSWYYPGTINQDTWYIRIVSSGNCKDSSNFVFIDMVTLPPPIITVTGALLTTPDLGYSYQWNLDGTAIPGATDTSYTASLGGNYTVTITDSNGCSRTSAVTSFVGLSDLNPSEFTMWPNPASDQLNLVFSSNGSYEVQLVNSLGQTVLQQPVSGNTTLLQLGALSKGVYFIKVDSGKGVKTQKLILR